MAGLACVVLMELTAASPDGTHN